MECLNMHNPQTKVNQMRPGANCASRANIEICQLRYLASFVSRNSHPWRHLHQGSFSLFQFEDYACSNIPCRTIFKRAEILTRKTSKSSFSYKTQLCELAYLEIRTRWIICTRAHPISFSLRIMNLQTFHVEHV